MSCTVQRCHYDFLPDNSSSECLLVKVTLTFPVVVLKLVIVKVIGCFTPLYSNEPFHTYVGANTSSGTAMRRFNVSEEVKKPFTLRSVQLTPQTLSKDLTVNNLRAETIAGSFSTLTLTSTSLIKQYDSKTVIQAFLYRPSCYISWQLCSLLLRNEQLFKNYSDY